MANTLNLTTTRFTPTAWHSWTIQDLAQQLSMFMTQHHPDHLSHDSAAVKGDANAGVAWLMAELASKKRQERAQPLLE